MKRIATAFMSLVPVLSILAATPAEQAAEAAARKYIAAVDKGDMSALYAMLPKTYQRDISEVIKAFGNTVDADIWREGAGIVSALADIGIAKPAIVAEMVKDDSTSADDILKTAKAIKALAGSLSLDMLKTGDVGRILSIPAFSELGAVSQVIDDGFANVNVTGSKADADGVVNLSFVDGDGESDQVAFVQVDDVWVPKDMADGWQAGLAEVQTGIQGMKLDAAKKQQIMNMMPMIKGGLQNAKNAANKDQLGQSLMMAVMPMMMMNMGGGAGGFDFDED